MRGFKNFKGSDARCPSIHFLFYAFVPQRFVDEIFQFEFFVLSANYVTLCIMRHQKVDYKVVFL